MGTEDPLLIVGFILTFATNGNNGTLLVPTSVSLEESCWKLLAEGLRCFIPRGIPQNIRFRRSKQKAIIMYVCGCLSLRGRMVHRW